SSAIRTSDRALPPPPPDDVSGVSNAGGRPAAVAHTSGLWRGALPYAMALLVLMVGLFLWLRSAEESAQLPTPVVADEAGAVPDPGEEQPETPADVDAAGTETATPAGDDASGATKASATKAAEKTKAPQQPARPPECPRGMVEIAAGMFEFGSSMNDP